MYLIKIGDLYLKKLDVSSKVIELTTEFSKAQFYSYCRALRALEESVFFSLEPVIHKIELIEKKNKKGEK